MSKAVLISIHPKWCEKIARGEKTIEVRKNRPKLEPPFKCYIYCTLQGSKEFFEETLNGDIAAWNSGGWGDKKGKVIGEFVCDGIYAVLAHPEIFAGHPLFYKKAIEDACLTEKEVEVYSGGKDLYGWHISNLVIYDRPRELSEFFTYDRAYENSMAWAFTEEEQRKPITRPPQSWCYVEEVKSDG